MHTRIKKEGVEVLANWITETDTELNGKIVPSGSWMATFAITNEELLKSIKDGSITGLSLGSVSEEAMTNKYWFINKSIHYKDLNDIEEVIPLFISFVDKGANQYSLEIEDYNFYINKRDKNGEKMSEEVKNEEAMIPISAIGKLRDIFSINKKDDTEEKDEEIEEEKIPESPADITNKELLEQIPTAVAEAVKGAIKEAIADTPKDESIDKKDDEENEDDSEEDKKEEKTDDTDDSKKDEEDVEINKRQTSMNDIIVNETVSNDFYQRTHRDHLGRKIRK